MLKLAALIAVAAALGGWVRDQGVLERSHLLGSCGQVAAPAGDAASWYACREGLIAGYPELGREQCRRVGDVSGRQVWRCSGLFDPASAPIYN